MQNLIFDILAIRCSFRVFTKNTPSKLQQQHYTKCNDFLRAPMSSTQAHKASLNSNGRRWSKGQFFCVKNGHEVDLDLDLIISIQQPKRNPRPVLFFNPIPLLSSPPRYQPRVLVFHCFPVPDPGKSPTAPTPIPTEPDTYHHSSQKKQSPFRSRP